MILVLENEISHEDRGLAAAVASHLPESRYMAFVDDPGPIDVYGVDGVVLTGSTAHIYEAGHEEWVEPESELVYECIDRHVPLLGICFGHQLVNVALGGTVERDRTRRTLVEMVEFADEGVLRGVDSIVPVLNTDRVVEPGDGLLTVGKTAYDDHFATAGVDAPVWTVQFHPEFTATFGDRWGFDPLDHDIGQTNATRVFENFAKICGVDTADGG